MISFALLQKVKKFSLVVAAAAAELFHITSKNNSRLLRRAASLKLLHLADDNLELVIVSLCRAEMCSAALRLRNERVVAATTTKRKPQSLTTHGRLQSAVSTWRRLENHK